MKQVYLDYAAATPMSEACEKSMKPFFREHFYNASASYLSAKSVKKSLEVCRQQVASSLGSRASEIVFTAGGTEANNLAIQGLMSLHAGCNMITTGIEHDSVLLPSKKYETKLVPVDKFGRIKISELEKLIDDNTLLLSIGYVNHEIGIIQNLRNISHLLQIIRRKRQNNNITLPIYLHTDAAQAGCYLDLNVARLGVDMMSINGGKIYGPKQSGLLYVRSNVSITPLILGGGQERGLRSGTENVAAVHGFVAALLQAQTSRKEEHERVEGIRNEFAKNMQKSIENIIINTPIKYSSPHILNITIPGIDNERVMMALDERGFMVAQGSACSASSEEPSHVLKAIGLTDADARSSLRLSFGRDTTLEDAKSFADELASIVKT